MRRNNLIFNMSLIAVFSALSFVVTAFLAVPIASGAGYLNFQDCIIFALASLIHPLVGGIVGGLTGMLATVVGHDENTKKNLSEFRCLVLGISTDEKINLCSHFSCNGCNNGSFSCTFYPPPS